MAIKIEEQDFKNYFPSSNRFLHYCAKYYGLTFRNESVVEEAAHQAFLNVNRMYKRNQEFKDEAEKTGMVMMCFKYGIYNAYTKQKRQDRLPCRVESDVIYGDSDDEYNKYQASAVSNDKDYDNLYDLLHEFIDSKLTPPEKLIIKENILGGKTYGHISTMEGITVNALRSAKERAIRKLRRYVKAITSTEHTKDKQDNQQRYISESRSKLRIKKLLESIERNEAERNRYSEALSFVYLDEPVQDGSEPSWETDQ